MVQLLRLVQPRLGLLRPRRTVWSRLTARSILSRHDGDLVGHLSIVSRVRQRIQFYELVSKSSSFRKYPVNVSRILVGEKVDAYPPGTIYWNGWINSCSFVSKIRIWFLTIIHIPEDRSQLFNIIIGCSNCRRCINHRGRTDARGGRFRYRIGRGLSYDCRSFLLTLSSIRTSILFCSLRGR